MKQLDEKYLNSILDDDFVNNDFVKFQATDITRDRKSELTTMGSSIFLKDSNRFYDITWDDKLFNYIFGPGYWENKEDGCVFFSSEEQQVKDLTEWFTNQLNDLGKHIAKHPKYKPRVEIFNGKIFMGRAIPGTNKEVTVEYYLGDLKIAISHFVRRAKDPALSGSKPMKN